MAALLAVVLGRVGQWVAWGIIVKLIAALGVGFLVYTGVDALLDSTLGSLQSQLSGAAANVLAVLGMLRIDQAITVVFSAMAARLTLFAGKKLVFKGG